MEGFVERWRAWNFAIGCHRANNGPIPPLNELDCNFFGRTGRWGATELVGEGDCEAEREPCAGFCEGGEGEAEVGHFGEGGGGCEGGHGMQVE